MHMHRPVATARAVAAPALLFLFLLPAARARATDGPRDGSRSGAPCARRSTSKAEMPQEPSSLAGLRALDCKPGRAIRREDGHREPDPPLSGMPPSPTLASLSPHYGHEETNGHAAAEGTHRGTDLSMRGGTRTAKPHIHSLAMIQPRAFLDLLLPPTAPASDACIVSA